MTDVEEPVEEPILLSPPDVGTPIYFVPPYPPKAEETEYTGETHDG